MGTGRLRARLLPGGRVLSVAHQLWAPDKTLCRWAVKGVLRRVRGQAVGVEAVGSSRAARVATTCQLVDALQPALFQLR